MQTPDQLQAAFFTQTGALLKLVVFAMMLERGLAVIFEHDWFTRLFTREILAPDGTKTRESKIPGLKGIIALAAAVALCWTYNFDVLATIFGATPGPVGVWATSFVAAGGSAGAIKLFQGFLGLNKDARDGMIEARKAEADAAKLIALANAERAKAEAVAAKAKVREAVAPGALPSAREPARVVGDV